MQGCQRSAAHGGSNTRRGGQFGSFALAGFQEKVQLKEEDEEKRCTPAAPPEAAAQRPTPAEEERTAAAPGS
eukprot:1854048-Rhodomonas_salina.1